MTKRLGVVALALILALSAIAVLEATIPQVDAAQPDCFLVCEDTGGSQPCCYHCCRDASGRIVCPDVACP